MIVELFKELDLDTIIDLIEQYDLYIQSANNDDSYVDGWRPVCIEEFFDNEYSEGVRYE